VKLIDDLIESERSLLTDTQFTSVQFTGFATSWQAVERYLHAEPFHELQVN
jgi:hypothetical protein